MSVPPRTSDTASPPAARDLYDQARRAMAQLHPDAAADLLERARTALPGTPDAERAELAMRVEVTWSWIVLDREGPGAALDRLAALEQRAVAAGRPDLQALPAVQAGVVCARQGDMAAALGHLRRAVPLARTLPPDDRVRLLLNKGTIASQAGRWAEASADLGSASDLAASAGLEEFAFMARHNQGYVEYLRGDLPAALRLMQEADDRPVEIDRSVSRLDRARVLLEAGLVDDAAGLLREAIDGLRANGMAPERADAELDLARCELLRGRPEAARTLAAGVADRAVARGEKATELQARLVMVETSLTAAASSRAAERRDEAVELAEAARRAGLTRLALRAELLAAVIDARLGRLAEAATELARGAALARSPHLATRTLVAQARLVLAQARDDRRDAASIARRVRTDVSRAGAGMASLDLRTASGLHLDPIIGLDLARAASGSPWRLLLTAERWRAATAAVPMLRPPSSEDAAAAWSRLRVLHDEVRSAPASAQPGLHAEISAVELRLRRSAWADRGSGAPVAAAEDLVRARVDAVLRNRGAVAVSLQWIGPDLHALVVRPGRPVAHRAVIRRDRALALHERLTGDLAATGRLQSTLAGGMLATAVRSSLGASLAAIDDEILRAAGLTPDDPPALVVVPTGALATVPWGMLPSRVGRPTTVARSLGDWLGDGSAPDPTRVAAVAGRDVASGDDEVRGVLDAWGGGSGADGIGRLDSHPAAVVAGFAASDLVHIAAHGRHRRDNPLFSAVWLDGGSLFAHEFEGRPRRASQVVLSACSTGGVTLRPGDQPLGFASALLAYGVGTVVAPVSDVPDDTARRTMVLYHQGLAAGLEASAALADAVRLAASEGHWLAGAFTCFGAPWVARRG